MTIQKHKNSWFIFDKNIVFRGPFCTIKEAEEFARKRGWKTTVITKGEN